jgi:hypothetical protein
MALFDNVLLWLNNTRLRSLKKKKIHHDKIIIVFSHCLQNSECPQKIVIDLANCKRCGKCVVKNILEISEKHKVKCVIASGGEMAKEKVKASDAKVVVAIACNKELMEGLKGIFPKIVAPIRNKQPEGPCKDCTVDIKLFEEMLKTLVLDTNG